jgi:hypothetical protein
MRGGAVCHIRATSAGVRSSQHSAFCTPHSAFGKHSGFKVSAASARAGAMVRVIGRAGRAGLAEDRECLAEGEQPICTALAPPPRLRRFNCSAATLKTGASDLFSAPFASPSRNPIREANRCNLEAFKPEMPKVALYLVLAQGRLTLQVVCLRLADFRFPVRPPKSPSRPTRENPRHRAGAVRARDRARHAGGGGERLHSSSCLLLPLLPSPPRFRRPPLHLCGLSKTTTRSALPVDLAAQGSLRVASWRLRGQPADGYERPNRWFGYGV